MISLSGCAERVYETRLEVFCPSLIEYSRQFNLELADEIQRLSPWNQRIPEAFADYVELRDQIRACQEARGD